MNEGLSTMRSTGFWFAFFFIVAGSARADDPESPWMRALSSLVNEAERAAADQRDCDAAFLFREAFQKCAAAQCGLRESYLASAAEAADAANDIGFALSLYQIRLRNFPASDDLEFIKKRIESLSVIAAAGHSEGCEVPLDRCGNWMLSGNEECDDGNDIDGDGCSSTCRPEICGNGVVDAGEQCDDGNVDNSDNCSNQCEVRGDAHQSSPSDLSAIGSTGYPSNKALLEISAAAGVVVGVGLVAADVVLFVHYAQRRDAVSKAADVVRSGGTVEADEAAALYDAQVDAGSAYERWGQGLFWAGSLTACASAGVLLVTNTLLKDSLE